MIVDVGSILNLIAELGFVSVQKQQLVQVVPPIFNFFAMSDPLLYPTYSNRWNVTIQYLQDYAAFHPEFDGHYFICVYDGWREMDDPADEVDRVHTSLLSYSEEERVANFIGKGWWHEPRFLSKLDRTQYVDLPLPVLAYNRHVNDRNVLLIPDIQFLEDEFQKYRREVMRSDIPWEKKKSQILWRGTGWPTVGYSYVTEGVGQILPDKYAQKVHPRVLAVTLSHQPVGTFTPEIHTFFNCSYAETSIRELLQYKYMLDLDGYVSAWSGFYWKLLSNSVVYKPRSHWEQWYYQDLKPYTHFIPLRNLSPQVIKDGFEWCEIHHPKQCEHIAAEGTIFVRKLTYEYAVKEYVIH